MYLKGLDELDRKILDLLTQNARYTYSELGERLGLIEGYTVIVNPQKLGSAVSCYYELEARPDALPEILRRLEACPTVTQIYRVTGECCLHIHAVAADQEELERLMNEVLDRLPGVEKLTTRVILSRVKDVKGLRL